MKIKKLCCINVIIFLIFCLVAISCKTTETKIENDILTFNDFNDWIDMYVPSIIDTRIPAVQVVLTKNGK